MSLNRRIRVRGMQNQISGYQWFGLLFVFTVLLIWSPALPSAQTEQTDTSKEAGEPAETKDTEEDSEKTQSELPEWGEIESVVNDHFSEGSGRKTTSRRKSRRREQPEQPQKNELITQQDVSGLFKKFEKLGWEISKQDRKKILDRLLSESDFLVGQLRTTHGKQFMRKISKLSGGYDRIDRLREMPHGKKRIQEFIKGPDGDKMIEYMITTKNGKNLGKQISSAKTGRNFNEPTGILYTEKDVLEHLQKIYQTEAEQRQAEGPKSKPMKNSKRK